MDKNLGFTSGNTQPSAPPPTAPPSYEEAVGNTSNAPQQPISPLPYPIGSTSMPFPVTYNQPSNQKTIPIPPNYPGLNELVPQPHIQRPADPNFVPPQEIRIIHQHVPYALGPNPVKMTCPTCQVDIKTTTISDHQPSAHICCIVLCLIGCGLCSCLPYCMSAFMSVHHFCPNCKNYIGTWKG